MRRKLAYILLNGALIAASAGLIGAEIVKMDKDVSYAEGKDMVFKISEADSTYGGIEVDSYIDNDNYVAVNAVASEMENRLRNWGVDATVSKEGFDTVRVSFRAEGNDATEYGYLETYLAFSGGNFSVGPSILEADGETWAESDTYNNNEMFDGHSARIDYVNGIPVVVIGINYPGKDGDFGKLIDWCTKNTKAEDTANSTAAQNCYLLLWANKQEGDTYENATSEDEEIRNPNARRRLIFGEAGANAWFDATNDDDDYKEFQLIPNSAAIQDSGYDASKAGAAYNAARYYMLMLNASDYHDVGAGYDVNCVFEHNILASTETLIERGMTEYPALGPTLIATSITLGLLIILSVYFYRLGSLSVISNVSVTMLASFLLFNYFGAQFGAGALVGAIVAGLIAAFGSMYYFGKIKNELYAGRSPKKSHIEATKKSMWPILDVSIISIIAGASIFGFVPGVIGKMGLMLVISGFFAGVSNLLLLRAEGFLIANDDKTESKLGLIYGVDKSKVPNLLAEEKQTYFGRFAGKDFTKKWKIFGIVASVLVLGAIATSTALSLTRGNAYNFAGAYNDKTIAYIEYRVPDSSSENTNRQIQDTSDIETKILSAIKIDGKDFDKEYYSSIYVESSGTYIDADSINYNLYFYTINFSKYFDLDSDDITFTVQIENAESETYTRLQDALARATENVVSTEFATVSVKNVVSQQGTPSLPTLWLGLGLADLFVMVYLMLRFKVARGLTLGLMGAANSTIVMGIISATFIQVTPLVSLALIVASVATYFLGVYVLEGEKDIAYESRERDKTTLEFKEKCLKSSLSYNAENLLVFALFLAFAFVAFFGFAPSEWVFIFLMALLGVILAAVIILFINVPLSLSIDKYWQKLRSSFHLPKREKKNDQKRRRSAEPEEATFIGIND
ncbi:MAG: hypothetical protein IJ247_01885 [Bacilli bacterium]|nr:hypothetical protein [Bacilli bacterium]